MIFLQISAQILIISFSLLLSFNVLAGEKLSSAKLGKELINPESTSDLMDISALLKQIQGIVLINHGKGYSRARLDMKLRRKDRVMTMDGASVVLVQKNGCVIRITQNSIYTLDSFVSCKDGIKSIKKAGPHYARAIGSEAITDVPVTSPSNAQEEDDDKGAMPKSGDGVLPGDAISETGIPGTVTEVSASSTSGGFTTTQMIVTGVAVGLGLAVAGSSGGGNGSVSGQ